MKIITVEFLLRDWNGLDERTLALLPDLAAKHGILFWCREGEWRAIGGSRLDVIVADLHYEELLDAGYNVTDLVRRIPLFRSDWDIAIPVPAEVVRWLREEAEQLGETDAPTESTTE